MLSISLIFLVFTTFQAQYNEKHFRSVYEHHGIMPVRRGLTIYSKFCLAKLAHCKVTEVQSLSSVSTFII